MRVHQLQYNKHNKQILSAGWVSLKWFLYAALQALVELKDSCVQLK